ncbi:ScbR family autoregulator-binding transcription factor [Streptomyces sp. NPDC052023]|uniref:ScbR family autoregulator-binding transcription factor n=1 Tax=Streptomyces sp. NPDC052023 TaxID=3365681 RepID=UPI0037D4DAA6
MGVRAVKQERAVRTRAALIRAAAEVFAESGFAGATVTQIAERAGLTLGAMYFHFRSKEMLAREIVATQPDLVVPPLESEGLQHAIDLTLTWAYQLRDNPVLLAGARLVMDQELFLERSENSHQQWTKVLMEDFEVARNRRELRAGVDEEGLARLIVNACTGAQMHARLESDHLDLPARVEEIWRFLLPAVAVPSAAKRVELGAARGRTQ